MVIHFGISIQSTTVETDVIVIVSNSFVILSHFQNCGISSTHFLIMGINSYTNLLETCNPE